MNNNIHPVTPERHGQSLWQPFSGYAWAAGEAVMPLVGSEVARAAACMPIGFVANGKGFIPAAVLGLEAGVSLFVDGQGKWLGPYIPAALRARPFLLWPTDDGRRVLCVDEAAASVQPAQPGAAGEAFFAADGTLAPTVQKVLQFLSAIDDSKLPTERACASLQKQGLLVPWAIEVQTETGTRRVEGLYRVDEAAMAALPGEAFLELRDTGALPLAYSQLLSLHHFPLLGELARHRQASQRESVMPVTASGDLDLSFLESGDTLKFS